MNQTLARIKNSTISRLLGSATVLLFCAWFIMPACHCQWEVLFGNPCGQTDHEKPTIDLASPVGSQADCHCHNHPPKNFDHVASNEGLPDPHAIYFLIPFEKDPCDLISRLQLSPTRGPPSGVDQPQFSERRAFLRHRSLLI